MNKRLLYLFLFSCLCIFAVSCTKNNDSPSTTVNNPVLALTPSADSGLAGDLIKINYTSSAVNGIQKFHIEAKYASNPAVVLKDSVLSTTKLADDEELNYFIPDSATAGQKIVFTFTITDAKGNATTKTITITVSGSRPRMTISQDKTTLAAGDSVNFTIVLKSTENNLGKLVIQTSLNGGTDSVSASYNYVNQSSVSQTYIYHIPATEKTGDRTAFIFTVTNNSQVAAQTAASVTVK